MDVVKVIDGKYEILHEIKRGGFGVVYYGRDRLFGKPVAIKAISPELLGEAKYVDMFQAEALHAACLNHHNIVRLYDIKRTNDGQFYLIMEFIDGEDLGKIGATGRKVGRVLPRHLALHIITEACTGLEYAHTRRDPDTHQPLNIVHQDVSPSNIMITRSGDVKLIDFGMAGIRQRRSGNKREVLVQGKIGYLAPEQVDGTSVIDRRADIFSLGVILYELLTGERFVKSENPSEAVDMLRHGRWSLSTLADLAVPEALAAATTKALQHRPEKRYQSMNQLFLDLMNYLAKTNTSDDFAPELEEFIEDLLPKKSADIEEVDLSTSEKQPAVQLDHQAGVTGKRLEESVPGGSTAQAPDHARTIAGVNEMVESSPETNAANGRSRPDEDQAARDFAIIAAELDAVIAAAENKPIRKPSPVESPFYKVLDDDEEDGEMRTIIDVVRLSARSHRKAILATLAGLFGLSVLFTGLDTAFQWTAYGSRFYDTIFPPAIRIVSFPAGAQVYLDDKPIVHPTPVAIDKISPGVHKLMLSLPGFDSVVKSIQVPHQGKIRVAGEDVPLSNQPYVFRFKIQLEMSSKPPGAEVFLNGVKYTQPTPCRVVWEVGDPLQVEMEKTGFQRLAGFALNTIDGNETIEDRRLWRFQRIEEQREYYAVEGVFAKAVTISSLPSKAEIYLDGSNRPVGITGYNDRLLLTVGVHSITLKKNGYLSRSFSARVDENSPIVYSEVLPRIVRIFAKEATSTDEKDIGAKIVQLDSQRGSTRVRATTPAEFTLLPVAYTAILVKEGYDNFILSIPPAGNIAVATMQPYRVSVEVVIFDENTGVPLENVQISQQLLSRKDGGEQFFSQTDSTGVAIAELAVGQYRFRAKKFGYRDQTAELNAALKSKNRIVFKMSTPDVGER